MGSEPFPPNTLGLDQGPDALPALQRISRLGATPGKELVAMLLALNSPDWSAWTTYRLDSPIHRALLGPYGVELSTREYLARGAWEHARDRLAVGLGRWKKFTPFWNLSEDIAPLEHGAEAAPALATIRRKRTQNQIPPRGGVATSEVTQLLDLAAESAERGEAEAALQFATRARKLDGTSMAATLAVARLARESSPITTLNAYVSYLGVATEEQAQAVMPELFDFLAQHEPKASRPNEHAVRLKLLSSLADRYPDNPLPVIELARLELVTPNQPVAPAPAPGEPEVAATTKAVSPVARAFGRLESFRIAHSGTSIETLQPGAAEPWFELLASYDAETAHAFAHSQRDLAPHELILWKLCARGLEAMGHEPAALQAWQTLGQMTPDAEVALGIARLLASLGGSQADVAAQLTRALRSPDAAELKDGIDFTRAISFTYMGEPFLSQGIEALETLHKKPELNGVDPEEVTYRLAVSLLWRGAQGDGKQARPLFEQVLKTEQDPLRKDLLRALALMSKYSGSAPTKP
jgi:tetratricopeptide (TPR) repeat protein